MSTVMRTPLASPMTWAADTERRRHLVRIWLRDAGQPFYHG